jgi:hypothetical protein
MIRLGDLQKHVQFLHPYTLDKAISAAVGYCALQGSVDKISKPETRKALMQSIKGDAKKF